MSPRAKKRAPKKKAAKKKAATRKATSAKAAKKTAAKKPRPKKRLPTVAADPARATQLEQFLDMSAVLTGFDLADLWGTGMVETYRALVPSIVGDEPFGELLTRWRDIAIRGSGDPDFLDMLVATELLPDDKLGPIACNVATLWYLGMWYQLPLAWRNAYGANAGDTTFVVSSPAYTASLVWRAMHTHPPAAKQPGYGSWALPPAKGVTP